MLNILDYSGASNTRNVPNDQCPVSVDNQRVNVDEDLTYLNLIFGYL